MKTSLKNAAKKAYKQLEQGFTIADYTHAQFLDVFSKWCGYRDYFEAKNTLELTKEFKKNKSNKKPKSILEKTFEHIALPSKKTLITGASGCGKSGFIQMLISHIVTNCDRKVRVIDADNQYKQLIKLLSGSYISEITEESMSEWNSDQKLVAIDAGIIDLHKKEVNKTLLSLFEKDSSDNALYILDESALLISKIPPELSNRWIKSKSNILVSTQLEQDISNLGLIDHHLFFNSALENMAYYQSKRSKWMYYTEEHDEQFETTVVKSMVLTIDFTTCP